MTVQDVNYQLGVDVKSSIQGNYQGVMVPILS